ncbi:uncharacterized protein EKO05_0010610 [Ascochyta rabiei]|uniref:uncharacterized protein n=1 Tax=Didymella rabiei TaxID=5454 RepID=UPI0021FC99CF|nr:uncharacterized protein EKO05_0010610 [Ascochyta rabiei]UPX20377.1 hypothetical protein EKO05_0010610 [Ascochyta rabiei]
MRVQDGSGFKVTRSWEMLGPLPKPSEPPFRLNFCELLSLHHVAQLRSCRTELPASKCWYSRPRSEANSACAAPFRNAGYISMRSETAKAASFKSKGIENNFRLLNMQIASD